MLTRYRDSSTGIPISSSNSWSKVAGMPLHSHRAPMIRSTVEYLASQSLHFRVRIMSPSARSRVRMTLVVPLQSGQRPMLLLITVTPAWVSVFGFPTAESDRDFLAGVAPPSTSCRSRRTPTAFALCRHPSRLRYNSSKPDRSPASSVRSLW